MTIDSKRSGRRRRSSAETRTEALICARRLLLDAGPGAVTLRAVADGMGTVHGNLTHHFGSADALRGALAETMAADLIRAVQNVVEDLRERRAGMREVVDLVFDSFDAGGAGPLIAWLASSGDRARLSPLWRAIGELADTLKESQPDDRFRAIMPAMVGAVIVPALGAAVIGRDLAACLGLREDIFREATAIELRALRDQEPTGASGPTARPQPSRS